LSSTKIPFLFKSMGNHPKMIIFRAVRIKKGKVLSLTYQKGLSH